MAGSATRIANRPARAVLRHHHAFFGPGRGIAAELRAEIGERFQADLGGDSEIVEGWLYWPITAGGLGLRARESNG